MANRGLSGQHIAHDLQAFPSPKSLASPVLAARNL
jgi:hypothetical protein